MSDNLDQKMSLLQRLVSVTSGKEVAELLFVEMPFEELSKHSKEPAIRRAIMLLAADDQSRSANERSMCAASLAKLWSMREIRGIVDEFSPRFLKEPLDELPETIPSRMRLSVPAWLAGKRNEWIPEFAARVAVMNAGDDEFCRAYLVLLLDHSSSISIALRLLNQFVAEETALEPEIRFQNMSNLSSSLAKLLVKTKLLPGKGLANEAHLFLESALLSPASDPKALVGELAAELMLSLVKRFPGLMMNPTIGQILRHIGSDWFSPQDKKWLKVRKEIIAEIGSLVAILGMGGIRATALADLARELASKAGETDKLFLELSRAYDYQDHVVFEWLSAGGKEVKSGDVTESRSDTEALAAVMQRADELAQEIMDPDSQQTKQIHALTVELGQYAARKGLRLENKRGDMVAFDPLRQRAGCNVIPGSQVRILVPAIIRKAETGIQLIVPAVVEPADENNK